MSTILYLALAGLLIALGVLGCFVAKIPGPLLSWLGLVVIHFTIGTPLDWWAMWIVLPVIIVLSMIFTAKVAPKLAAKAHEFGKAGKWGTFVGSMITLILAICNSSLVVVVSCLFILPYVFAFLFELISVKSPIEALKRGGGSYILYLTTTLVKLAIVYVCFLFAFDNAFGDAVDAQKEANENPAYTSIDKRASNFNNALMSTSKGYDADDEQAFTKRTKIEETSSRDAEPNYGAQKYSFSGEVAGAKCTFNLLFSNDGGDVMDVTGYYYYNKIKQPITLRGDYNADSQVLNLTEIDDEGNEGSEMALFGDIKSTLVGTFLRPDGKSFAISLENDD